MASTQQSFPNDNLNKEQRDFEHSCPENSQNNTVMLLLKELHDLEKKLMQRQKLHDCLKQLFAHLVEVFVLPTHVELGNRLRLLILNSSLETPEFYSSLAAVIHHLLSD